MLSRPAAGKTAHSGVNPRRIAAGGPPERPFFTVPGHLC